MIDIIIYIVLYSIVGILSSTIASFIFLPFIYGLPRAITLVLAGNAKFSCILAYLVSPLITLFILYAGNYYFPFFIEKTYAQGGIAFGLLVFFGRFFLSSEMKLTMATDFNIFMDRYMIRDVKQHPNQLIEYSE